MTSVLHVNPFLQLSSSIKMVTCEILLFSVVLLNRHQTILHTFSQLFLNLTLSGVPHLHKQLPNEQYLSDLCKMCNLEANL